MDYTNMEKAIAQIKREMELYRRDFEYCFFNDEYEDYKNDPEKMREFLKGMVRWYSVYPNTYIHDKGVEEFFTGGEDDDETIASLRAYMKKISGLYDDEIIDVIMDDGYRSLTGIIKRILQFKASLEYKMNDCKRIMNLMEQDHAEIEDIADCREEYDMYAALHEYVCGMIEKAKKIL